MNIHNKIKDLNIPVYRNMSRHEIDSVCLCIESIFISAMKKYVPEIKIPHGKAELSTKSMKL